jgi:hypothetical protein
MQATPARQKGTTVAATKVAPPASIAQAGATLLDQIARRNSIDQEAAANAVGKAMEQLIAGARHRREGAVFFFASRSREGRIEHRTDRDSCSCEAGQGKIACWHRAARHLIITLMRQQNRAIAEAAERASELLPPPTYCRHCHNRMLAATTPGGEACYECERCRWTVMAALFAPAVLAQNQADPAPAQTQKHRSGQRAA